MRTLYAFGEMHDWVATYAEFRGADALANFIKSEYTPLREAYVGAFLSSQYFGIVFCEGFKGAYSDIFSKVGYNGNIVYLDKGFKQIEDIRSEAQKIVRTGAKELHDMSHELIDRAKLQGTITKEDRGALKKYHKEKAREISTICSEKLFDLYSQVNQREREEYWAQIIDKNLENEGLLICGANHIDSAIAFLPSLLKKKGISLSALVLGISTDDR